VKFIGTFYCMDKMMRRHQVVDSVGATG